MQIPPDNFWDCHHSVPWPSAFWAWTSSGRHPFWRDEQGFWGKSSVMPDWKVLWSRYPAFKFPGTKDRLNQFFPHEIQDFLFIEGLSSSTDPAVGKIAPDNSPFKGCKPVSCGLIGLNFFVYFSQDTELSKEIERGLLLYWWELKY